jgi:hypothetical protein
MYQSVPEKKWISFFHLLAMKFRPSDIQITLEQPVAALHLLVAPCTVTPPAAVLLLPHLVLLVS